MPTWISVREARARLSDAVSHSLLYSLTKRGVLASTKIGGRVLIDADSLADLISRGRIAAVQPRPRPGRKKAPPRRFKHFSLD